MLSEMIDLKDNKDIYLEQSTRLKAEYLTLVLCDFELTFSFSAPQLSAFQHLTHK